MGLTVCGIWETLGILGMAHVRVALRAVRARASAGFGLFTLAIPR